MEQQGERRRQGLCVGGFCVGASAPSHPWLVLCRLKFECSQALSVACCQGRCRLCAVPAAAPRKPECCHCRTHFHTGLLHYTSLRCRCACACPMRLRPQPPAGPAVEQVLGGHPVRLTAHQQQGVRGGAGGRSGSGSGEGGGVGGREAGVGRKGWCGREDDGGVGLLGPNPKLSPTCGVGTGGFIPYRLSGHEG